VGLVGKSRLVGLNPVYSCWPNRKSHSPLLRVQSEATVENVSFVDLDLDFWAACLKNLESHWRGKLVEHP
jgi:hypothetical protein